MTDTRRRRPWRPTAPLGKDRWRKLADDSTCRSGCGVCGKDPALRRMVKRRERALGRALAQEQLGYVTRLRLAGTHAY